MPREPKPFWREVPAAVQEEVAQRLGAPVRRAVRVFGGFGPSATFRLFLADGRTVFAKGAGVRATEHHWRVVPREEQVYRSAAFLRPWSPAFYGAVRAPGWHLLLLEDLRGVTWVPPWSKERARQVVRGIAAMHAAGMADPFDAPELGEELAVNWRSVAADGADHGHFLSLFGAERDAARDWLGAALPALLAAELQSLREDQPRGLIHSDIRSDNLALRGDRLVLFDWADLRRGPLAIDIAGFLPSLESEGGTAAAEAAACYRAELARCKVLLPDWAIPAAACAIAGYFASRAGRPAMPGLPRLRGIQQAQLRAALPWAAEELGLPAPPGLPA